MASYIRQLVEYIRKNLEKGYTLDSLKYSLIEQGYSRISVEKAIEMTNKQLAQEIPPIREKPQITYRIVEDEKIKLSEKKGFWKRFVERYIRDT